MPLRKVVDATVEPLTLAEAKLHLREDLVDAGNDAYIAGLITAARTAAEEQLQRTLLRSTWLLTCDRFPPALRLERPPILAVEALQYIDQAGVLQTLSPTDYKVDSESEPGYVVPAYGCAWPVTRSEVNAVQVRYTGGYGTEASAVPPPIVHWIKLAIGQLYRAREAVSIGGVVSELKYVDALLDPYRILGV